MILRAMFWLGIVAVLAPHEPLIMPQSLGGPQPYLAETNATSIDGTDFRGPFVNSQLISEWRDRMLEIIPRLKTELEQDIRTHPKRGIF